MKKQFPSPSGTPGLPKIPAMGGESPKQKRGLWLLVVFLLSVISIIAMLHQFGLIDITEWIDWL